MTSPSLVFVTLLTGLIASLALPAQAQTAPLPLGQASEGGSVTNLAQADPAYRLIHVSPTAGSDTAGDGSQMKPLRTISRALQTAEAGTVIVLAPGEYSEATGETFPLQLRSGVTVQGMPGPNRSIAVIRGGGVYPSPSQGYVNAAIVGADRAGLGNVIVSNPNTQGYGIWVESGSPILRENTFAGNGRAGIHLAGTGQPVIQRNYFTQNGVAGLMIGGDSQAQVQGNTFENTGIGIQISAGAVPRIEGNRIVQNQDGLILQANARPILANNEIARNRRNGLVEFQATAPDRSSETVAFGQPLSAMGAPISPWGQLSATTPSLAPVAVEAEPPRSQLAPPTATPQPNPAPGVATPPAERAPVASSQSATPIAIAPPLPTTPALPVAASEPAPAMASPEPSPATAQAEPTPPVPSQPAVIAANPPSGSIPVLEPAQAAQPIEALPPAAADRVPEVQTPAQTPEVNPSSTAISIQPPVPQPEVAPSPEPTVAVLPLPDPPAMSPAPAAGTSGIAALRARVLAQQEAQAAAPAVGGADETASEAIELAVIPAPQITAAPNPAASPQPRGNIAALRERLLNNRNPAPAGGTAEPSEGVAIQVTPPPVPAVAQPNTQNLAAVDPSLPLIPAQGSLPAAPPRSDVPALSPTTSGDLPLLRVPGPNIPIGSGGTVPEILASSGGIGSGPPAPPSRASSLGLNYKVFVPAPDDAAQSRVRAIVPDAFRVRVSGQVMMQAGAFADQATADAIANNLIQQGLDARVQHVP